MIVPVETVGRLIGNAGATVKELIKTTKAFIQVSQRPPPNIHLPERVMKSKLNIIYYFIAMIYYFIIS